MGSRSDYFMVLAVAVLATSCAYENEEDLFGSNLCDPQEVTYSEVINPLMSTNCAITGCHDGSNTTIPDWTSLENVQSDADLIKQRTGNRTMPPSSSGIILSAAQISDIACWVDSGAQNN